MATRIEGWAQAWLNQLCKMIAGVSKGALALGIGDDGPLVAAALWPDPSTHSEDLIEAAEQSMREQRGIVRPHKEIDRPDQPARDAVAIPLLVEARLVGAIAVEVPSRPEPQQRAVMKLLQWGSIWLEILLANRPSSDGKVVAVLEVVATCLEHARFQAAATAVATELATRLDCERVALGFARGDHIQVLALSHSAKFGEHSKLISDIGEAMDEAVDQGAVVVYPSPPDDVPRLTRAHEKLASEHGAVAICTIPLRGIDEILGGLTLERTSGAAFDPETVELCGQVGSLMGPILELKRRDDQSLARKAREALRMQLSELLGPDRPVLKGVFGGIVAVLLLLVGVKGDYRVAADARLEGTEERVVVAAFDGFISQARARAGDIVQEGDSMGALDSRDRELERFKWSSKREQLLKEYRGALASHDSAQVRILSAQVDAADAELELLDEQLARSRLIAPFEGIVVAGDLSQRIGSPVERGEVLFKVAPLDEYRVVLEVDEREISELQPGQHGRLALSAMPRLSLPLLVERITPVSTPRDGRNLFRVEARLDESPGFLRPGMEGVAKVEIDRRRLGWIWFHRLFDWLRLWAWSWMP